MARQIFIVTANSPAVVDAAGICHRSRVSQALS